MRTKTILLSAAALAAGVLSSQAQSNVYSANIVGYANVVLKGNGQYSLVANPFNDGNGNYLTNVLNGSLPKQSQVLTWGGATFNTIQKLAGGWPANSVQLAPGAGFFVRNGGLGSGAPDLTNTFVGSVAVLNGASATNSMPVGYTLHGSTIPYSGNVAVTGTQNGDTNLNYGGPLTKQSQILTWISSGQTYFTVQKLANSNWNNTATIAVGDGFFVNNKNGPATNMVQSLNVQ